MKRSQINAVYHEALTCFKAHGWTLPPESRESFVAAINGKERELISGEVLTLAAGERITLVPGIYHAFWAGEPGTIIGEVSTANDDTHDNFFVNPDIGRYPGIDEDEAPEIYLINEYPA